MRGRHAGYLLTDNHHGEVDADPHRHTVQLSGDYALSKRIDVYVSRTTYAQADRFLPSTTHS
jgi:predicted porin